MNKLLTPEIIRQRAIKNKMKKAAEKERIKREKIDKMISSCEDEFIKKITSGEVRELYGQLSTFFKELDLYNYPDVIIAALEISKYQFIREIERLSRRT